MIIAVIILAVMLCSAIVYIVKLLNGSTALKAEQAAMAERLSSQTEAAIRAQEATTQLTRQIEECRIKLEAANNDCQAKQETTIRLESEIERIKTQLENEKELNRIQQDNLKEQQEQLARQTEANFKVMANDILQQQSTALRATNEQRIGEILNPLKEEIDKFSRQVSECYSTEARERFSLQQRIKDLVEANNNIGREARELTAALRGNSKKQGDWGELVLENILESSGLRKGFEFTVQQQSDDSGHGLRDENGRGLRPDVVVHCPGGRVMIIDSKVSLTAFTDYVNADDDETRNHFGKLHLASVNKHISELSAKNYQDYIGDEKLDFVMMFIPNEGAYSAALTLDPGLWQKAYDKRVLIVSPTQLVGSLRLINQLWNHDRQTRNAIEIAEKSGQMYDKFVGFVTDMEKIEKALNASQSAYIEAMKKLRDGRGNLVGRAEALRQLGIKATKRLRDAEPDQSDT